MRLSDVEQQIKEYFDSKTPDEVIKDLRDIGVEFEDESFCCDREPFGEEKCKTECDWCKHWNNYKL